MQQTSYCLISEFLCVAHFSKQAVGLKNRQIDAAKHRWSNIVKLFIQFKSLHAELLRCDELNTKIGYLDKELF